MSNKEKQQDTAQNDKAEAAKTEASQATSVSPGKQLREGREKLGLTQEQVAHRLHLRLNSVIAVENDALEEGVSVTFTKGYVRLYAKLVRLDATPLLADYDTLHSRESQPAKLQSFSRRVSREAHDHRWNMVSVVVGLLVVGSIVFWWVDREGYLEDSGSKVTAAWETLVGDGESNDTPTQAVNDDDEAQPDQDIELLVNSQNEVALQNTGPEIPEEDVALANNDILDDATSEIEELNDSISEEASALVDDATDTLSDAQDNIEDTVDNAQSSIEETVAQVTEPEVKRNSADIVEGVYTDAGYLENADGTVDVVFTFKDDCWVSVKDANGDTMAYGVKTKGRVMEVSGIPPVRIILGAPQAVEIDFGGQRVDMSVYPGGESAKFSLPVVGE